MTEGQLSAVKRNDKRIEDLKESIEEMLTQLKTKSAAREKSHQRGGKSSSGQNRSEETDEDWLDTTEQTADASTNWRLKKRKASANGSSQYHGMEGASASSSSTQILTYEDLRQQKDTQMALLAQLHRDIAHLEAAEKLGLPSTHPVVDEVEALVVATRSKEATLALKPLRIEESKATAKLASIEKLLKIATPALQSLVQTTASSSSSGAGGVGSSSGANSTSSVAIAAGGDDDNNNTTATATTIGKSTAGAQPLNPSIAANDSTNGSDTGTISHTVPPPSASSSSSSSSSSSTATATATATVATNTTISTSTTTTTTTTTTTGKDTKKDTGKKRGRDHDVHMQVRVVIVIHHLPLILLLLDAIDTLLDTQVSTHDYT